MRERLRTRRRIGFGTGVLGQRYRLDPDRAWGLPAHVSQELSVEVRRVAEVVLEVHCGRLDPADEDLASRTAAALPLSLPARERV